MKRFLKPALKRIAIILILLPVMQDLAVTFHDCGDQVCVGETIGMLDLEDEASPVRLDVIIPEPKSSFVSYIFDHHFSPQSVIENLERPPRS